MKLLKKSLVGLCACWSALFFSCGGPVRDPIGIEKKASDSGEVLRVDLSSVSLTTDYGVPLPPGSFSDTVNGVPFTMVAVAGGEFEMGDLFGDGEADENRHRVVLPDYFLGETEVTQRLWQAVMGKNPSFFEGCPDCPVEQICWQDAKLFLDKLNALTGRSYRLPTEAEWEFAARERGKKVRFANGRDTATTDRMNFDARPENNLGYAVAGIFRDRTVPVKSFPPNGLGLFEMSGNVWEFCSDWYGAYPHRKDVAPNGPKQGTYRVLRGGSWANDSRYCRASDRDFNTLVNQFDYFGFRLAMDGR